MCSSTVGKLQEFILTFFLSKEFREIKIFLQNYIQRRFHEIFSSVNEFLCFFHAAANIKLNFGQKFREINFLKWIHQAMHSLILCSMSCLDFTKYFLVRWEHAHCETCDILVSSQYFLTKIPWKQLFKGVL